MGRRRRKSNIGGGEGLLVLGGLALIGMAIYFILKHFAIIIVVLLIVVLSVIFFMSRKYTGAISSLLGIFKTGHIELLPKIQASDEVKQKATALIEYVYAIGAPPSDNKPSKKYQHNILCQFYSLDNIAEYEPYAKEIFENVLRTVNPYKEQVDEYDFYESMHYAFETLIENIIGLASKKGNNRDLWNAIDNMAQRLLQINTEKFMELFFTIHEYHFWYVYNRDEEYKSTLQDIENSLELYHGIKQTEFYKKVSGKKNDISHALYFAEKSRDIIRIQDGRSYRLYLPEDNIEEILPYEYTYAAVYDGDFDYKKYWKDIEKILKKNDGILQTEFYEKFNWSREILTRALRDAARDGKVVREKKGSTYILHPVKALK
jgi:hypothetical protein